MAKDKVRVRLTHFCHRKGCEGKPGQEIEVGPEDAKYLLDNRGAVPVKETPETAADGKPGQAETR